jgi:hypothetical protein
VEDELGESPYARIVQKILALCIAGGGVLGVVIGGLQPEALAANGVAAQLAGFAATIAACHIWFGGRNAWASWIVDRMCIAFMCIALSELIGLWAYMLLLVLIVIDLVWNERSMRNIDLVFTTTDAEE